jgi:hypothetical protein
MAIKKLPARKKTGSRNEKRDPQVLKLPLVGKIKRADIRKAVLAVRAEKAQARAANGER